MPGLFEAEFKPAQTLRNGLTLGHALDRKKVTRPNDENNQPVKATFNQMRGPTSRTRHLSTPNCKFQNDSFTTNLVHTGQGHAEPQLPAVRRMDTLDPDLPRSRKDSLKASPKPEGSFPLQEHDGDSHNPSFSHQENLFNQARLPGQTAISTLCTEARPESLSEHVEVSSLLLC